jgi:ankyrin repeat protein
MTLLLMVFGAAGCGSGVETEGQGSIYTQAAQGEIGKVRQGIESGFDVNTPDAQGKTLLHHAVEGNQHALVELLLVNYRADAFVQDNQGVTAVDAAIQLGNPDVLDVLRNEELVTY